jgi:UDP-glucose 4-epimerase
MEEVGLGSVILVTGGAGYIGSHAVAALRQSGREVVVLDDLSEGHRAAIGEVPLAQGSLLDRAFVRRVFDEWQVSGVFHFAARCLVGQSVTDPGLYYEQNVVATLNLVDAMIAHGVRKLVLSSTAATYGDWERMPITEETPQAPVNPYGETKLVCERMLASYHRAHGLDSVSLRYFNAAGADPSGNLGEDHAHETHLIPLVVGAALGHRDRLTVLGTDYPTPDGTCVRDYVHVVDLAQAHLLALRAMEDGMTGARAFNLGNSRGTSVLEIIRAVERVGKRKVPFERGPRRPGDPAVLVASSESIGKTLGWRPRFASVDAIVETAWRWHETHPKGYGDA